MTTPASVVIVGESIAGITAARELRRLGFTGRVSLIGNDPHGGYSRPVLSKDVLRDATAEAGISYTTDDLDLDLVRARATRVDTERREVVTDDGQTVGYDALVVATGAAPRRLARPGQRGELVLRDLADARQLRSRLDEATSALVVGAGFLGMEVASACAARAIPVTVIDAEPPLRRLLGPFLSKQVAARATERGVDVVLTDGPAELFGDPVSGVALADGRVHTADLVVTCAGDTPSVDWLSGTGLADDRGIAVDDRCRTSVPGVYAAGDVAYLTDQARAPFWSNAVAQARVAACSVLGLDAPGPPRDDYFWTEITKLPLKVVGPIPVEGEPTSIEGDLPAGDALLRWDRPAGASTLVAYGRRFPVGRLRAMARRDS